MVTEAFSGINTTNPIDAAGATAGLTPPSVTTTEAGDLLVLGEGSTTSNAQPSAPSGATLLTALTNGSFSQTAVATEIATSVGATSKAAWSASTSTAVTGVVALRPSTKSAPADPPQAITFTSTPPANPTVGGTYTVSATGGGSGNPVTFSIDSSSTSGACSIPGTTVSFTGAGTCVIDANQAGNANYSAAPQVQQSFSIAAADPPQAITFTSTPPTNPAVGGTYTVSATGGGSGNPVTFSIDASSTSGACSISGATLSFVGAGTCVIDANQAAGGSYSAAPQVQQSFSVAAADPPTPRGLLSALGVCAGGTFPFNPALTENFASTTDTDINMVMTPLADAGGWSELYGTDLTDWLEPWIGTPYTQVFAVPMIVTDSDGNPLTTLAEGAAGDNNSYFTQMAETLVADGFGSSYLRLGWEFDGTWAPWSVANDTDAANFAAYWRNIVTVMRSVPGANFKFVWSLEGFENLSWDINDAYPGNAYVDYVSMDVYDWSWDSSIFPGGDPDNTATIAQSNQVFNDLLTAPEGLSWLASFAQAHGKQIGIPEWAVTVRTDGHGLGDDSTFITNMVNWMVANQVAWANYFDSDDDPGTPEGWLATITDGNFPNALAAFETDLG
jgi:hypothetical protein